MFATYPPSANGQPSAAPTPAFQTIRLTDSTVFLSEAVTPGGDPYPVLYLSELDGVVTVKIENRITPDHPQYADFGYFLPVLKVGQGSQADFVYLNRDYDSAPGCVLWSYEGAGALVDPLYYAQTGYSVPLDSITEDVRSFVDAAGNRALVGGVNRLPNPPSVKAKDSFSANSPQADDVLLHNFGRGANASAIRFPRGLMADVDGNTTLRVSAVTIYGHVLASCEFDFVAGNPQSPVQRPDSAWSSSTVNRAGIDFVEFPANVMFKVDVVSTEASYIRGGLFYSGAESAADYDV